jgi:shikimate dehydrogenase
MNTDAADRYAVIGYPIKHSWSPFIHGMFAQQTGHNLTYTRMEVTTENFPDEIARFFDQGGRGLNVTVPHKQAAYLFAHHRTRRAKIASAINTIAVQADGLLGDNTDGAGLMTDLTSNLGFAVEHTRVLLLGAGGAARGVLGPLLEASPEYVEIANRDGNRALDLAEEFSQRGNVRGCGFDQITDNHNFDLVLNATSASLQNIVPPVPVAVIGPTTLCYDMAYGIGDTSFTRWAIEAGAGRAETGWGMLVEQAAEAFLLWRGVKPNTMPVLEAVKSMGTPNADPGR